MCPSCTGFQPAGRVYTGSMSDNADVGLRRCGSAPVCTHDTWGGYQGSAIYGLPAREPGVLHCARRRGRPPRPRAGRNRSMDGPSGRTLDPKPLKAQSSHLARVLLAVCQPPLGLRAACRRVEAQG